MSPNKKAAVSSWPMTAAFFINFVCYNGGSALVLYKA